MAEQKAPVQIPCESENVSTENVNDEITINGVKFTIKELTIFKDSYFSGLISTNLDRISSSKDLIITFPEKIDPEQKYGQRLMDQFRIRLDNGYYFIGSSRSQNYFYSFDEVDRLFDYLLLPESEYELVQVLNDEESDDYDDYPDQNSNVTKYQNQYDPDIDFDDDKFDNLDYDVEDKWDYDGGNPSYIVADHWESKW
jgi:hypothetical protein